MFIANWCIYIYTYTLSVRLNELMWGSISVIWKTLLLMLISLVAASYDQTERRSDKNVVKTRENYSFWNHYWYVVHKNNVKNIDLVTKFYKKITHNNSFHIKQVSSRYYNITLWANGDADEVAWVCFMYCMLLGPIWHNR